MKILKVALLSAIVFFASNTNVDAQKGKKGLKTEMDSVSYALGIEMAKELKNNIDVEEEHFNYKMFIAAFTAVYNDDDLLIEKDSTQEVLSLYFTKKKEMEKEKARAEGIEFLEKNKQNDGVMVTESGLQYEVIQRGTGAVPEPSSRVKVHYKGSLIDGTEFDSSYERGEAAVFGVGQVIKGWTEALLLMHVGDKFKLYIPSDLAYGERGAGGVIPPYSVLIFEVELLDIE